MSEPLEQRSRQIDRDKRAVETAAMLALLPLFGTAQDHAQQALKIGADPVDATHKVLAGERHHPSVVSLLASAAVAAWLMGYFRSTATAHAYATQRPVSLAGVRRAVRATPNVLRPLPAHADALGRMIQGAGGRDVIGRRYAAAERQARPLVNGIEDRLAERLNRIRIAGPSMDVPIEPGAHLPDAISRAMDEARIAFEKTGVSDRLTWYVPDKRPTPTQTSTAASAEAIVEAVVGQEYEQGRGDGYKTSSVLWGWVWSATIDGHTCRKCRKLHGTQAPKDDPLWDQFGPLSHFGCRCSRVEVWAKPGDEPPTIKRPDLTDSDILEGVNDRRLLLRYWRGLTDTL